MTERIRLTQVGAEVYVKTLGTHLVNATAMAVEYAMQIPINIHITSVAVEYAVKLGGAPTRRFIVMG